MHKIQKYHKNKIGEKMTRTKKLGVTVRTTMTLSAATVQKLEKLKELTGQSQSGLCNLAIQAGLDAIGLAINPEWKKFFENQVPQYDTKIKKL